MERSKKVYKYKVFRIRSPKLQRVIMQAILIKNNIST